MYVYSLTPDRVVSAGDQRKLAMRRTKIRALAVMLRKRKRQFPTSDHWHFWMKNQTCSDRRQQNSNRIAKDLELEKLAKCQTNEPKGDPSTLDSQVRNSLFLSNELSELPFRFASSREDPSDDDDDDNLTTTRRQTLFRSLFVASPLVLSLVALGGVSHLFAFPEATGQYTQSILRERADSPDIIYVRHTQATIRGTRI